MRGPGQQERTWERQRAEEGGGKGLAGWPGWGEPARRGGLVLWCQVGTPLPPLLLRCRVCLGASCRNVTTVTPPRLRLVMPFPIVS